MYKAWKLARLQNTSKVKGYLVTKMLESFPYRRISQIRDNLHWCLYVNCSVMKAGRSNLMSGISASVNVKSLNHLMFLMYFHWNNNGNFASLIRKRMQHSGKHLLKKSPKSLVYSA